MLQKVRDILFTTLDNLPEAIVLGQPDVPFTANSHVEKLRVTFRNSHWVVLKEYFKFNNYHTMENAEKLRRQVTVSHALTQKSAFATMKPWMRAGWMEYVWNGVMLPYSASRGKFTKPNP
jgi:hypothetical protein